MKFDWKRVHRHVSALLAFAGFLGFGAAGSFAQSTNGSLNGSVIAAEDGSALPGAQIEAVHEPTGTRATSVSDPDGRFRLLNLRVGGPYTVRVAMDGFRARQAEGVQVNLGDPTILEFRLDLESITETLLVVAESSPLINPGKTGASSNVSTQAIEALPTVGRGFADFARTNPFFTVSSENQDPDALSVAGRSSRYNNISIDGSVNNDLFGLGDSGTPGSQSGTAPISLDAIQELELVIADFDVRNGGFSGGSVNAVTRSGANDFAGSVFFFTRDDGLFGDGPAALGAFGDFSEDQYGFRLGGPIARDKVFFFLNADIEERTTPTGWSLDGTSGQAFAGGALVAEANRFRDLLIGRYGFDPGGLGENAADNPSDKYFGRIDFNLNDHHNLTVRHNFVDAANDINRPNNRTHEWPSESYAFTTETNSTVAQLNSVFGPRRFNELRVAYQTIRDRRSGRDGLRFPWIEIEDVNGALPGQFEFEVGTEAFSAANSLDQDILEIHNDFTWLAGDHTITLGTHNELFSFGNLFIQNFFGAYEFADLDAFEAGRVRRYNHTFPNPGQNPVQEFDVNQIGIYAGDQWAVRPNLTLTYGLRVDVPFFPDQPDRNPRTEELYGLRTDDIPDGQELIQPRFGFNWDFEGDGTSQLRGGIGVFAGRAPYVWISNQYARNALAFTSIQATGGAVPPFEPDPDNQPQSVGGAATEEVNLIDPGFEFPQVLRYNLAYDRQLPWWDLVVSAELIHADSLKEIDFREVNLEQVGVTFDGRPLYERISRDFTGAFLITNTDEGEQTNFAIKVERPFRDGLWGFVSYAYNDSKVVNEGTSSRASSNFNFSEAVDPNNASLSTSDFQVEHRINAAFSYRFNRSTRFPTTVSLFYNLQSGRPFSWTMGSDFVTFGFGRSFNGDGTDGNDLLYVPAGPDDVVVRGGTWADLDAFISSHPVLDQHRGRLVPRNADVAPWNHTLDLHFAQDLPVKGSNLQLTVDLLNLANLFDEDAGVLRFANFNSIEAVEVEGFDDEGRVIYSLQNVVPTTANPQATPIFQTHNTRSRWRAKVGVRWTF